MRKISGFLLLLAVSAPLQAGVMKGVDFRDAFGGLLGLGAVLFFMALCFRGDKNPPAEGFITDKRLERELRGEGPGSGVGDIEPE